MSFDEIDEGKHIVFRVRRTYKRSEEPLHGPVLRSVFLPPGLTEHPSLEGSIREEQKTRGEVERIRWKLPWVATAVQG
jgi:hypothetical protein